MVCFSRTTFLLSGCLFSFCPLSQSSLTGFRPNLDLMLHPLSCPQCPSSPLLLPPTPVCFFSWSFYEILPYPILSLRPFSPGVAGEIRGYNFRLSAESGPQHLTPSSLALPLPPPPSSHESPPWPGAEEHQQSQWETSLRSAFCNGWVTFIFWSRGKNKPTQRKRGTNEDEKQILILCVCDEMERVCREGQRRLGSHTQRKEKASEGQRRGGAEVTWRRTDKPLVHKHIATHEYMHTHAAHHTQNQSAMDKKIMPLSFLECFLQYPLKYHHPSPTLTKHCLSLTLPLFSKLRRGFRLGCSDSPRLGRYKHSPVLSRAPKAAHWAHQSGPRHSNVGSTGPMFCSQLASKSTSAIWHCLRSFNSLQQPHFVIREQRRKCFTLWMLLLVLFSGRTMCFAILLCKMPIHDHHPPTPRGDKLFGEHLALRRQGRRCFGEGVSFLHLFYLRT